MQQRRRTMMNDPVFMQRATQMLEQPYLPTPGPEVYGNAHYEPVERAARPVSWHPSTQQVPQTQQVPPVSTQPTQYPFPSYYDVDFYNNPTQFPPTPAAYSAYSSPVSTLSPLALPYSTYELPQTYSSPSWNVSAAPVTSTVPAMNSIPASTYATPCSFAPAAAPSQAAAYQSLSPYPANWACYGPQGVNTPPTPEDPPKMQQPEPVLQTEESIPYQPLEEDEEEEEGDILIGLGLYDPPEKLPYQGEGGLLGASFEPTGKGLKLEDAWEPPASDDEEDEDGEGEAESADEE